MILYTVGHSTQGSSEFIDLLAGHGIGVVVDVRSKPRSRLAHFDQVPLEHALQDARIRYRYMGDKLGGMPRDPAVAARWRQGKLDDVIVAHLRSTDEWADGISELAGLVKRTDVGVCIMCSERDPHECHRKAVALDTAELLPELEIEHVAADRPAMRDVGIQEILL